jgi:hypothetical protein
MAAVIFRSPLWRYAYHIAAYRRIAKGKRLASGQPPPTKATDHLWKRNRLPRLGNVAGGAALAQAATIRRRIPAIKA